MGEKGPWLVLPGALARHVALPVWGEEGLMLFLSGS